LYEYVIDLYLSRGGTLFSVGSDGHYLEHFRFHFDDLFALLKAKGVTELAIYQKGKRIMVPLPVQKNVLSIKSEDVFLDFFF
ncbi:TPA: hypothetical protein IWK12_002723, partial [Enterococcus faecium]|nr:hypothetical protein [Enterococcus faecium]